MPKRQRRARVAAPAENGQVTAVDDLIFRYSTLTDTERRQFDRKYAQFRAVRRQFSGVFERMSADAPREVSVSPEAES